MDETNTGVVLLTEQEPSLELVNTIRQQGGYKIVEYGFWGKRAYLSRNKVLSFPKAIERVIERGAGRVLIIPVLPGYQNGKGEAALEEAIANAQANFPKIEIVMVPFSLDPEVHARYLIDALQHGEMCEADDPCISLDHVSAGDRVILRQLGGGNEFVSRLAALGFIPGSPIRMIQNFGTGPLIVAVRGTRLALGREEARKLGVQDLGRHCSFGRKKRQNWHRARRHGGRFGR